MEKPKTEKVPCCSRCNRPKIPTKIKTLFFAVLILGALAHFTSITSITSKFSLSRFSLSRFYNSTSKFYDITKLEEVIWKRDDKSLDDKTWDDGSWKDDTLLNIPNFRWIHNNKSICHYESPQDHDLLLFIIHSPRWNFDERERIRVTWGRMGTFSYPIWRRLAFRYIFLLGTTTDPIGNVTTLEDELVTKEHKKFGDTIVGNVADNVASQSYIQLMGYKWALNFCNLHNSTITVTTEDKVFHNIPLWLQTVGMEVEEDHPVDYYCLPVEGLKPPGKVQYDGSLLETYPKHCSGAGFGVTIPLMKRLYMESKTTTYFPKPDVFINGFVLSKVSSGLKMKKIGKYEELKFDNTNYRQCCKSPRNSTTLKIFEERSGPIMVELNQGESWKSCVFCFWHRVVVSNSLDLIGLGPPYLNRNDRNNFND